MEKFSRKFSWLDYLTLIIGIVLTILVVLTIPSKGGWLSRAIVSLLGLMISFATNYFLILMRKININQKKFEVVVNSLLEQQTLTVKESESLIRRLNYSKVKAHIGDIEERTMRSALLNSLAEYIERFHIEKDDFKTFGPHMCKYLYMQYWHELVLKQKQNKQSKTLRFVHALDVDIFDPKFGSTGRKLLDYHKEFILNNGHIVRFFVGENQVCPEHTKEVIDLYSEIGVKCMYICIPQSGPYSNLWTENNIIIDYMLVLEEGLTLLWADTQNNKIPDIVRVLLNLKITKKEQEDIKYSASKYHSYKEFIKDPRIAVYSHWCELWNLAELQAKKSGVSIDDWIPKSDAIPHVTPQMEI